MKVGKPPPAPGVKPGAAPGGAPGKASPTTARYAGVLPATQPTAPDTPRKRGSPYASSDRAANIKDDDAKPAMAARCPDPHHPDFKRGDPACPLRDRDRIRLQADTGTQINGGMLRFYAAAQKEKGRMEKMASQSSAVLTVLATVAAGVAVPGLGAAFGASIAALVSRIPSVKHLAKPAIKSARKGFVAAAASLRGPIQAQRSADLETILESVLNVGGSLNMSELTDLELMGVNAAYRGSTIKGFQRAISAQLDRLANQVNIVGHLDQDPSVRQPNRYFPAKLYRDFGGTLIKRYGVRVGGNRLELSAILIGRTDPAPRFDLHALIDDDLEPMVSAARMAEAERMYRLLAAGTLGQHVPGAVAGVVGKIRVPEPKWMTLEWNALTGGRAKVGHAFMVKAQRMSAARRAAKSKKTASVADEWAAWLGVKR